MNKQLIVKDRENKSPGPEVIKLFSCSTQLCMKFKLLINTVLNSQKSMEFSGLNHKSQLFILLINVKMPTNVGI